MALRQVFRSWDDPEKRYVVVGGKKINLGKPIGYGNKTMTFKHPENDKEIKACYGGEFEGYRIDF